MLPPILLTKLEDGLRERRNVEFTTTEAEGCTWMTLNSEVPQAMDFLVEDHSWQWMSHQSTRFGCSRDF